VDIELFNKLMAEAPPQQQPPEWLMYLKICEMHLKEYGIRNPIVVELGVRGGNQKKFYEQLLSAEHIGTDVSRRHSMPDILGSNHDPETLRKLKEKLRGRPIDILFIDASHRYNGVKKDYEIYSPLCNGIVAFHDIETKRYSRQQGTQVWLYWDELKKASFSQEKIHENFLFLSLHQCHTKGGKSRRMGIGIIIKK